MAAREFAVQRDLGEAAPDVIMQVAGDAQPHALALLLQDVIPIPQPEREQRYLQDRAHLHAPHCPELIGHQAQVDEHGDEDAPERRSCIGAEDYEGALYALRDALPDPWATFYAVESDPADAARHTFLRAERFYEATTEGQTLSAWIGDLVAGTAEDRGSR